MELDIPVEVAFAWGLNVGIGVNRQDGAFVVLAEDDGREFNVDVTVDLPESQAFRGQLGFLELIVNNNGSGRNKRNNVFFDHSNNNDNNNKLT